MSARMSGPSWEEFNGFVNSTLERVSVLNRRVALLEAQRGALPGDPEPDLEDLIRHALNAVSARSGSNTPDFILARYLVACLEAFNRATIARASWWSDKPSCETVPKGTDS